jgi:hypothetical protein
VNAETTAHEHRFPFATPGVLSSVTPCECGKTCAQDYADRRMADALAAMESAYPARDDRITADLINAVAETAYDTVHEHCDEDGCTGGGLPFWRDATATVLEALTGHARIVPFSQEDHHA